MSYNGGNRQAGVLKDIMPKLREPLVTLVASAASVEAPRMLLHCCCAPCASYVLEKLSPLFKITILFYNPNILPQEEFCKRAAELEKLLALPEYQDGVDILACGYAAEDFRRETALLLDEPEGGLRCGICFRIRLEETAKRSKEGGFDYFTTTLSVSPHKNAQQLNEIGGSLAKKYAVNYLQSDFKKRDGYKRSIELSRHYNLYRQDYCGCTPRKT